MKWLVVAIFLTSCSAAMQYDIDVSCNKNQFYPYIAGDDEQTQIFSCNEFGDSPFFIRCNKHTIQEIEQSFFCTTHDGKKVKIKVLQ